VARQIPAKPRFWRDSALPFAEIRSAADSRACYRPHTHATFSIGVVDAGRSVFTSQGHSVPLAPGMLVAVPAGCVHACNPAPGERWSYQMLHLEAAWMADTLAHAGAPPAPQAAIVVQARSAHAAFCALNQCLFSHACAPTMRAALTRFLTEGTWRSGKAVALPASRAATPLARVQAVLQARHAEALPLALLAEVAAMQPRALVDAFRTATGMTPHIYQMDLRVNAARSRLREGDAPADVASDLGFYDQSHFHHAFQQRVAATSGDYRR